MARRESRWNWLWVLPSVAVPIAVSGTSWANHVASEGRHIAPNVRLVDVDVSGIDLEEAAALVEQRADELASTPVVIDLGDREVTTTAGDVGFRYLTSNVLADLARARHGNGPVDEFTSWLSTPFETITVDDRFTVDVDRARRRLSTEDVVIEDSIEPRLEWRGGPELEVVDGANGLTPDVSHAVELLAGADPTAGPVEIRVEPAALPPRVSQAEAAELADELNRRTRYGLVAVLDGRTANVPAERVRPLLSAAVENGELVPTIDLEGLGQAFREAFPEPVTDLVPPKFDVVDGQPVVVAEGRPPTVCCSPESVEDAGAALLAGNRAIYVLEPRLEDDPKVVAWANGSSIVEPVAEFTTRHACCENRVVNIHTIAATVRGYYLVPGQSLSLNQYVGPRTAEKGYLPAGAIRSGHMTDEVGGGVSQFSTTLFNAAFFAGLDLDVYQSHSVYFSRYPFGREATLSNPNPDLVITNVTDHPVLIWPTYDDTSITVTMYSTRNVEVVELEQRVLRANQCRRSEIDRQRTFSDGRVVVDTIIAFYRPGDGIDCNGRPIPEPDL